MIFAHGPIGYIVADLFLKRVKLQLDKKRIILLFLLAIIGAVFPDIDLIYYYFVKATFSHHEVATHSFLPYFIVFITLFLILHIFKNKFGKLIVVFFFSGIASHLLADSLGAGVVWFWPFSNQLYGLYSINFYQQSWLGNNFFAINYSCESIITFITLILILNKLTIKQSVKKGIYFASGLIAIIAILFIIITNNHLYHSNSEMIYGDFDNDKIINRHDRDIDGDKIDNINDIDIDNDNETNTLDLYKETFSVNDIWYDTSEGGLIEIPLRMGFVTNSDLIVRLYESVGIFFREEMLVDYEKNPTAYNASPKNKQFERDVENWQAWLSHQGRLFYNNNKNIGEYDVLFFNNDIVALALWVENGQQLVLIADPVTRATEIITLKEVEKRKGPVLKIGRILPKVLLQFN